MIEYIVKDIADFTDEEYKKSFLNLSDIKKEKVKRFNNDNSKKCTIAGEMLARKLLARATGRPKEFFEIVYNENGKPFCANVSGIYFNISHSATKVAAVVCKQEIGIDIEIIRPVNLKLAKRICTYDELVYIFGKKPSESDFETEKDAECIRRFLEVWTLKEAYLKCVGTGITGFNDMLTMPTDYKKIKIANDMYVMHIVTLI